MGHAIRIYEYGNAKVLKYEDFYPNPPGEGEVLIKHEAIGLNFIDVYHRTGLYPLPELPAIPGLEGSGKVESLGENVTQFNIGDRVAYAGLPPGAYSDYRLIPAHRLVKLPEKISYEQAAGMMLKGMTARYLVRACYAIQRDDKILIHAAAGGVGSIVCQWARSLGAIVIGTVGSEEKADIAKSNGCNHPILYSKENFVDRINEITDGEGVDVVYDSIGKATFLKSLDCLRPMGTIVSFGQASGAIPPFDIGMLAAKGSLFLTRPSLMTYTEKREDLLAHAEDLFDVVLKQFVKIEVRQSYPLSKAVIAHEDLESRKTKGSTILIPGK